MTDEEKQAQLQELYKHLDCTGPAGNTHLAWYGQLRAREVPHKEAIEETLTRFKIRQTDWYKRRMEIEK